MKLNIAETRQLERLDRGENVASSDRSEDRARTRLKKFGLIEFDRAVWRWRITPAGRAAINTKGEKNG